MFHLICIQFLLCPRASYSGRPLILQSLLGARYRPGLVLGIQDANMNKTDTIPARTEVNHSLGGGQTDRQTGIGHRQAVTAQRKACDAWTGPTAAGTPRNGPDVQTGVPRGHCITELCEREVGGTGEKPASRPQQHLTGEVPAWLP